MPGTILEYLVDNKGIKDTAFFLKFPHNCLYCNCIITISKGQEVPGWLSQLSVQLLDSAQMVIWWVVVLSPMSGSMLSRPFACGIKQVNKSQSGEKKKNCKQNQFL